jgi:hypothetical protein
MEISLTNERLRVPFARVQFSLGEADRVVPGWETARRGKEDD